MTGPTKPELAQQVEELEGRLADLTSIHETARTLQAVANWDREARAISRCVVALESLNNSDRLRSDLRADVSRVLQYLATRYGVPMVRPDVIDDLRGDLNDLIGTVRQIEAQQLSAEGGQDVCGGCSR